LIKIFFYDVKSVDIETVFLLEFNKNIFLLNSFKFSIAFIKRILYN